jgi:hypothetical protein
MVWEDSSASTPPGKVGIRHCYLVDLTYLVGRWGFFAWLGFNRDRKLYYRVQLIEEISEFTALNHITVRIGIRYRPYFDIDLPFGLGYVSIGYPVDHKKTVLGPVMTCDEPMKKKWGIYDWRSNFFLLIVIRLQSCGRAVLARHNCVLVLRVWEGVLNWAASRSWV